MSDQYKLNSERAKLITLELIRSFTLKGDKQFMPKQNDLIDQANEIDNDLDKNIDLSAVRELFNVARYKEDHPGLTGLRKACNSDLFKNSHRVELMRESFNKSFPNLGGLPSV